MASDVRETKFRVMISARVFNRKSDGTITQMFIDECEAGTLPTDGLTGDQVAFVQRNGKALIQSVALCLLKIAEAADEEGKKRAAKMEFTGGVEPKA